MTVVETPVSGPPTSGTSPHLRLLVAMLAGASLIRIAALGAFPEITADEGLWTNSSKNRVVFGDWFMDLRTHLFLSPVFHGATVAVFGVLGPSIAAARLLSAVAGSVSVFLLYVLVTRVTGRRDLGLTTALVFAFDALGVMLSRRALVESFQLCIMLLSVTILVRGRARDVLGGGLALGVAMLTKLNTVFLLPVLGLFLLARSAGPARRPTGVGWRDSLFLAATSIALAGMVYWGLYAWHPQEFVQAFGFELDGVHFESRSNPVVRLGRFGLDPIQLSRTILGLFRESPFPMVLATCGAAIAVVVRPRGAALFGPWLIVGMAFFLAQMFQPVRYFHLVSPAVAFFAAVAVNQGGGEGATDTRRSALTRRAVLGAYLVFSLGYVGVGAVANRATKLEQVVTWVRANTDPAARIMAAGYFCTDLPNRAYAHYHLARDTAQLVQSLRSYRINYVVYDSAEWRPALGTALAARFPVVKAWSFGVVYQVMAIGDSAPASPRWLDSMAPSAAQR